MVLRQLPAGLHPLPFIHHHPSGRVLHAETLAPIRTLNANAVWAQQLQIPDLVLPVVAQRHDVVHLEPEMMRLVETTTRANAPLHRVQRYPHRLRHVLALIADPAPAGRALFVHLHRFQVLLQQRHVHRPVGLAINIAAAADPGDQLERRTAVALRGAASG